MSDVDNRVKVGIEITQTGTGAADAAKQLDQVKEAAGGSKTALGSLKHAHEEAGHAAEGHGHHMRGIHKIAHALNEIIPGLGLVMQAAFSPIGAIIMGVMMALRYLHEWIKKDREEFEKLREELEKPLTKGFEKSRDAIVDNAVEAEKLAEKLRALVRHEQSVEQEVAKVVAMLKEQAAAAKELTDAQDTLELDRLKTLLDAKLITQQEYEVKKTVMEEQAREAKRKREEEDMEAEIAVKHSASERAAGELPGLKKKREAATTAKEKADYAVANQEDLLTSSMERKEQAKKALTKYEGDHNNDRQKLYNAIGLGGDGVTGTRFQELTRKAASATFGNQHILSAAQGGEVGPGAWEKMRKEYDAWVKLQKEFNTASKNAADAPEQLRRLKVQQARAAAEAERAEKKEQDRTDYAAKAKDEEEQALAILDIKKRAHAKQNEVDRQSTGEKIRQLDLGTPEGQRLLDAYETYEKWQASRTRGTPIPEKLSGLYKDLYRGTGAGVGGDREPSVKDIDRIVADPKAYERLRAADAIRDALGTSASGTKDDIAAAAMELAKHYTVTREAFVNMLQLLRANHSDIKTFNADVNMLINQSRTVPRFDSAAPQG